jgi:hypothetical protein
LFCQCNGFIQIANLVDKTIIQCLPGGINPAIGKRPEFFKGSFSISLCRSILSISFVALYIKLCLKILAKNKKIGEFS